MTPDEFWAVIDRARQRATPNSERAMLDALYRELVKLPDQELFAWYDLQQSYMALAHTPKLLAAAVLINGGSSDDRFTDFTAWLVAQGKTVYESALANPDSLAQIDLPFDNAEWEFCGYIAGDAYEGKQYLDQLRPEKPAGRALRSRCPQRADLEIQVERICMDTALHRPFRPTAAAVNLDDHILQIEILQRIRQTGPIRDFWSALPESGARQALRRGLAADLDIDTGKPAEILQQALPRLWQKRTEWEETQAAQRPHPNRGWER